MYDMSVTHDLTVNNVICNGGTLSNACLPTRVRSVNGVLPNGTTFELSLVPGPGIAIVTSGAHEISISNAGVLSVGLAVPSAEFSVSNSPVTTTGTLTITKQSQIASTVWAGPLGGASSAPPSFRLLNVTDMPALPAGQIYIGTGTSVIASNLTGTGGITITPGTGTITIGTIYNGTVTSVGLSLPSSLLTVVPSSTPITMGAGTLQATLTPQGGNLVFASLANGTTGTPLFRSLVDADLPPHVTSVALALPGAVFSVSGSPVTTTGTLTGAFVTQGARAFFAGPTTGSDAAPSFRVIALSDLPPLTAAGSLLVAVTGGNVTSGTLIGAGGITVTNNGLGNITLTGSGGTVTSVGLTVPAAEFNVTNSPLTGAGGTLVIGKLPQMANKFWAGPVSGASAAPTFRSMTVDDFAPINLLNGQLLIGSTGGAPVAANLVNGSNIVITNTAGGIMISASINASAIGTVHSVDMTVPGALLTVAGGPVTTYGTFNVALAPQSANQVFLSPNGASGTPSFRTMLTEDLPQLGAGQIFYGNSLGQTVISYLTAGTGISLNYTLGTLTIATNTSASVSSVGLAMTGPLYTVSGSPVTAAGTLTATLNTQAANTFFAGPTTNPASVPTFRAITLADFPPLQNGQIYMGQNGVPVVSGLSAGSGITITNGMGTITISSSVVSGETNTASNVGTAGVGVFKQKTGVDLEFKKLYSVNAGKLVITDDTANSRITFAIDDPWIDHDVLMNYIAAEHVDHNTVSILAGTGLTGGGTIAATRTLSLDVNGLTADATPTASDFLLEYDVSAGGHRKVLVSSLPVSLTASVVTGTLPVNKGGTNSAAALNNNRIMVSSSGGAIVEAAALTNGQMLIGSTGSAPVAAALTGTTNQVTVTNGAGSITLSLPQNVHTTATPTFASQTLSATTNQLVLGTFNTVTLSSTAPSASRVYTLHDAGAAANFMLNTAGAMTVSNAPTTGQVLTATSSTTSSWQTASSGAILIVKSVNTTGATTSSSTNWSTLNNVSLTATGTWQCTFEASIWNNGGSGSSTNDIQYEIASTSGTALDNSYRRYGDKTDSIIVTTAEVVVASAPLTVFSEWKQTTNGASFQYSTKASTGRSLRCWKSS
jgi:hypothetical protein